MQMDDEEPMDEEIELMERNGPTTVHCDLLMGKISVFHQCFVWESNYQTMRLYSLYNKLLWKILINSSSTHSFVDLDLAKKLGCKNWNLLHQFQLLLLMRLD